MTQEGDIPGTVWTMVCAPMVGIVFPRLASTWRSDCHTHKPTTQCSRCSCRSGIIVSACLPACLPVLSARPRKINARVNLPRAEGRVARAALTTPC